MANYGKIQSSTKRVHGEQEVGVAHGGLCDLHC
jgi:hypothetical protein